MRLGLALRPTTAGASRPQIGKGGGVVSSRPTARRVREADRNSSAELRARFGRRSRRHPRRPNQCRPNASHFPTHPRAWSRGTGAHEHPRRDPAVVPRARASENLKSPPVRPQFPSASAPPRRRESRGRSSGSIIVGIGTTAAPVQLPTSAKSGGVDRRRDRDRDMNRVSMRPAPGLGARRKPTAFLETRYSSTAGDRSEVHHRVGRPTAA